MPKTIHRIFSLVFLLVFWVSCGQSGDKDQTDSLLDQSRRGVELLQPGSSERHALVIGNGAYKTALLKNPVHDARDMADLLEDCGFEVSLYRNAGHQLMETAIRRFGKKISRGGIGLFYYAGHGMQVDGVNYLIPVDSKILAEDEIKFKAVDANFILNKMEAAGNKLNILILDACRDNPFARSFRSGTRGLARMDAPRGSLIVYSTSPGKTAADGQGRNGIFTKHLIRVIRESELEIAHLLRQVRRGVSAETRGAQIPWESSSLMGEFYFYDKNPILPVDPPDLDLEKLKREAAWRNWEKKMVQNVETMKKIDGDTTISSETKKKAWEKILKNFNQNNPYSEQDEQLRTYMETRIRYWQSIPKPGKNEPLLVKKKTARKTAAEKQPKPRTPSWAGRRFRSRYQTVSKKAARTVLKKYGFYDSAANKTGQFKNKFQLRKIGNARVVVDLATGLMWHQAGSPDSMVFENAGKWLRNLNQKGYAGFHDWRLPTLEEGASLVENRKSNGDLYIDPIFSPNQRHLWTGDIQQAQRYYVILFNYKGQAGLFTYPPWLHVSVRPVRSIR